MATHRYRTRVTWTGNHGTGTSGYGAYGRDHRIEAADRPPIDGSSDAAFRGDAHKWSPEDLFVASISACHKLWYLHLCAEGGVVVTAYVDRAEGTMTVARDGGGRFTEVVLHPEVTVADLVHDRCGAALPRARARQMLHRQFAQRASHVRADDSRA